MKRLVWSAPIIAPLAVLVSGCEQVDPGAKSADIVSEQLLGEVSTFAGQSVSDLMADAEALRVGGRLFDNNCGGCHGSGADQPRDSIDLTNHVFNYGVSEPAVYTTVSHGRVSEMPGMGSSFGEVDLGQVVAFVESLAFESPLSSYAARGKQLYDENCANCHGAEGFGNGHLGASNLSDEYWQHGNSMMNIRLVITRGVKAECPGFSAPVTSSELELLTAYVLSSIS